MTAKEKVIREHRVAAGKITGRTSGSSRQRRAARRVAAGKKAEWIQRVKNESSK